MENDKQYVIDRIYSLLYDLTTKQLVLLYKTAWLLWERRHDERENHQDDRSLPKREASQSDLSNLN